eukprot:TRINITY_DN728_c0_g1_i1.p2 TRINITY_DN728_c0_g1~~TRINITY_DN728_c0_g1_i1.p2  ORF type:complete len:58 (+),score=12.86 TRINITY_DN728_c0_g1_i1:125-298(+)
MGTAWRMTLYKITGACPDSNLWSSDDNCGWWAVVGYCKQTYVSWMNTYCAKTCCETQ